MLFQIYGSTSGTQLLGWLMVFVGLILLNEIARRTKIGGIAILVVIPIILTIYFIAIQCGAFGGHSNQTYEYMNGWFHYFKLYAATIGCIGFMMIKYEWGIGKSHWFKAWPFVIVAANILIAVVSDLESAYHAFQVTGDLSGAWWASNEGVFLYGGWWNILNALAGILNIFCMTSWWNVYSSKDRKDMLWPDMTVWFILAYDVWNFQYTYANLPTHSWYCGVALLLAPTFANALWNKGGWIQNRANTLAIWCMFAQVVPLFQLSENFSVLPSLYKGATGSALDLYDKAIAVYQSGTNTANEVVAGMGITANPIPQGVVSILALAINVIVLAVIIKRAKAAHINPYKADVFVGTKDFVEAEARRA
ncbi:DUF5692 family protein [Agathobacter ruminis]|uniref:Uncharacterized protein n=1 Tax=Agathobacter ruminis TaxID=1712665 RepID=A0A2G3DZU6_9FIRM|nr:DUF5692 family protein [Agathobacter ruminis]MDC7300677.1 DUF5692 family protein [Agathobacter ruminis]PHU36403.1 hypothetical protein CSX02_12540 [Agathobacter ruminis]